MQFYVQFHLVRIFLHSLNSSIQLVEVVWPVFCDEFCNLSFCLAISHIVIGLETVLYALNRSIRVVDMVLNPVGVVFNLK